MTSPRKRQRFPVAGREDDRAWFHPLFQDYHPIMVSAAYNRLNNLADAEEAAAEVFRIAWDRREALRDAQRLAWLYATLRNVVGNEYRRRTRADRRSERAENELAVSATGIEHLSGTADRIEVRDAVIALPVADRELIWMAYWEELTREEMAEVLECSVSAVRVRLHRAKARLKTLLHQRAVQNQWGEIDA